MLLTLCLVFREKPTLAKMELDLIFAHWTLLLSAITKIITLDVQWISTFVAVHSDKFVSTSSLASPIRHIALLLVVIVFPTAHWALYELENFQTVDALNWLIECKRFGVCSPATVGTGNKIPGFLAVRAFHFISDLLLLKVIIRALALGANSKANFFAAFFTT